MKQTGHKSVDAVRMYKRPSQQHKLQISKILQPPPKKINKAAVKSEQDESTDSTPSNNKTIALTSNNSVQHIHITF